MALAAPRTGSPVVVSDRELESSFFMMKRTTRRWGLHSMLYAAEPWAVMEGSVATAVTSAADRRAGRSFINQAREYFSAAERATAIETRPLLYYYAFLNLAKALSMARGRGGMVGKVSHGIAYVGGSGHDVSTAKLSLSRSVAGGATSAIDELWAALGDGPPPTTHLAVNQIVGQTVVAHRLWREAAGRKERFIPVEKVELRHDPHRKTIWAAIYVRKESLQSRGRGLTETAREGGLSPNFRAVSDAKLAGVDCRVLEQCTPVRYSARSADKVMDVVNALRPVLWQTITSAPPYRRYYLYLSPPSEVRLPQWQSIYAILFWLGSLTRYQPVELLDLFDGPYGPYFREFLESQPSQLLYMFASEFRRQDVARAAVV